MLYIMTDSSILIGGDLLSRSSASAALLVCRPPPWRPSSMALQSALREPSETIFHPTHPLEHLVRVSNESWRLFCGFGEAGLYAQMGVIVLNCSSLTARQQDPGSVHTWPPLGNSASVATIAYSIVYLLIFSLQARTF